MTHRLATALRACTCLLATLALYACGGASSSEASASPAPAQAASSVTHVTPPPPPAPPATSNSAPRISGTPPLMAVVDQPFSFQPAVRDADNDRLTFAVSGKPSWATFDKATGRLWGTPQETDIDARAAVAITVSDGLHAQALPAFSLAVQPARKAHYGHYFATHYSDTPADAAMLCEQPGVSGVVWRRTWNEVEPAAGKYDFRSFDQVLAAIAASRHPRCQLWLFVEFKSFNNSPVRNPCPAYLQARHSAPNSNGHGAATCFMWEREVLAAYVAMMKAAAARYDRNPRVEGLIVQESSLSFNGDYSQDVGNGGSYTATAWRDALISIIDQCAAAFASSRCMAFLNFLRGGQSYLHDISAAISAVPGNQACMSGPDLLPNESSLYDGEDQVYPVLTRHPGCRANSAQNNSYHVPNCEMDCIFHFAVGGTFGAFPMRKPLTGGLCINSYLFWNNRSAHGPRGHDWQDAQAVISAHPYGADWLKQCAGSDGKP